MAKKCSEEEAITALLAASTITEAARLLGVSRRTVYNYLGSKDFEARLQAARDERDKQLANLRETATVKAVNYLVNVVEGNSFWFADTSQRIAAAKVLLTFTGSKD